MYTIPASIKNRYLTEKWMPVVDDNVAFKNSVFGRIDVVDIVNSGSGYNNNIANTGNPNIITVIGDGSGAELNVVIENGTGKITDVLVVNPGENYTHAKLVITDIPGSSGSGANLTAIISPYGLYPNVMSGAISTINYGGNGANPKYELGATAMMLNLELNSDENGTIPIDLDGGGNPFKFRQVSIIRNPLRTLSNGAVTLANSINLSATHKLYHSDLTNPSEYIEYNSTIYQTSIDPVFLKQNDQFSGNVVNYLRSVPGTGPSVTWLNNITGTFIPNYSMNVSAISSTATAYYLDNPEYVPYSGDILYVNNRAPVVRTAGQTEQIKLLLQL
jgi:hypothetical protein